ncbi:thrombospondin-related sporozoite protein, putative [Plasmodium relictum]|uniref:Thrombospondin-related sporozoite protein, putative n=1 Tax=Plasmodium relictum TaxID=85471 RepID=A0A1J1HGG6_PLARL|nr:thrombospondin-related sporozoite protein, putative [Plasmodium relictum]CRH03106.1 thrombospondin-related sporozoite protein, putative [Plasmodium relictum]
MLINISMYFFLLYVIKSHFDSFFGYKNNPSVQSIESDILLYKCSNIKNRILEEDNPVCDEWSEWTNCSKTCDVGIKMRVKMDSKKEHSRECSKITETTLCKLKECSESDNQGNKYETKHYNEEKETKKKILRKYLLIFGIISFINILLLIICIIVSLKKKII